VATQTLDPTGDGSTLQWTTTGTDHYTEIDDGDRDPAVPNTATKISESSASEKDVVAFTLEGVDTVSDVEVHVYGNDQMGGMKFDISKDESSWEAEHTANFGAGWGWDDNTWSSLSWSIGGTLTLYLRFTMLGGAGVDVAAAYVIVTYTEQAGGATTRSFGWVG